MIRAKGWIPDIPDKRDYKLTLAAPKKLAASVDLRTRYGTVPVYNQGSLGSCVAQAVAASLEYERLRQGFKRLYPSRLFIYWNARDIEGTAQWDAGAYLRDGMKVAKSYGACSENRASGHPLNSLWPYSISKFRTKPKGQCYKQGANERVLVYQRVAQTETAMKTCLNAGYPFVVGISVYESFESNTVERTGVVPMPKSNESLLGGHAVLVVGYNDSSKRFLVRNSWGTGWGMKGYFTIPYAYLTDGDLAADLWNIQLVDD